MMKFISVYFFAMGTFGFVAKIVGDTTALPLVINALIASLGLATFAAINLD